MKARTGLWLLLGGGVTAVGAALFAAKKSSDTVDAVKAAVNTPPVQPQLPGAPPQKLPTFQAVLTHYWPFKEGMSAAERLMEGGVKDSAGQPLRTVEDFLSGKSDHVSISGDPAIFPYGQKVLIPWGNKTLVGRITDTGDHFRGSKKVYRVMSREPLDVCVFSQANRPPQKNVTVQIVPGDTIPGKKKSSVASIATDKFKDQTVVLSGEEAKLAAAELIVGAYYDALEGGL